MATTVFSNTIPHSQNQSATEIEWKKEAPLELIPQATYRFQFHKEFTLQDAKLLIPYLEKLGITHCYASPILQARPGSTHGYDIVNHQQVNPEIGTEQDFQEFCDALHRHQMKLIVDIVPNHMGIGSDNQWCMDVLENGQASEFAHYFDIDWTPLKPELQGKVLLPVLGAQYGVVLENGELNLRFNEETGSFQVHYYDHFWPINPNSYPLILNFRRDQLEAKLEKDDLLFLEYQSIITALENLPSSQTSIPEEIEIRRREKRVIHSRLIELCQKSPTILDFIQQSIEALNLGQDTEHRVYLHNLLEMQCYRLAFWRVASDEINYRRFFDINDLASLNMQYPEVFEATHKKLFQWVAEGKIQGFRIDHPDGLYDPAAYFEQLQKTALAVLNQTKNTTQTENQALPLYLVVEKILAPHEQLPGNWPIHGTSGYEFGNRLTGLYVQSESEEAFSKIYQNAINQQENFEQQVYECKQLILRESLASELNVLASKLYKISEQDWKTRDLTLNNLRRALSEVIAAFPVYRTYLTVDENNEVNLSKKDIDYIQWAIQRAKKHSPLVDISIFDFIHDLLLMKSPSHANPSLQRQVLRFTMKFQQLTGPVMAKGLEDTAFYRYNRLTCLNEVGGEPNHFGLSIAAFHRKTQEQAKLFPHSMLNTSTHDSKRSEDVRARLAVLSEMPELWEKHLEKWTRLNRLKKSDISTKPQDSELIETLELAPDKNDECLIYQTLLGAWPSALSIHDSDALNAFKERIIQYMLKACREAKVHTSWINQNKAYEDSLIKFITEVLSPENNTFLEDFLTLQENINRFGILNSLSETLIKLTVPGVPDIYQGNESWEFNLVDPDNRRPVPYASLDTLINKLPETLTSLNLNDTATLKLWLTKQCLHYRKKHSELFTFGDYIPVQIQGTAENHVIAFIRQYENKAVLVIAPRFLYSLFQASEHSQSENIQQQTLLQDGEIPASIWKDTNLFLPLEQNIQKLSNQFTHQEINITNKSIPVSHLLAQLPFGLFELQ